jgi:hypothetical protein
MTGGSCLSEIFAVAPSVGGEARFTEQARYSVELLAIGMMSFAARRIFAVALLACPACLSHLALLSHISREYVPAIEPAV